MARDISDEERERIAAEDFAGKNRSYPIKVPEDVHDAASSLGRAGADNYPAGELKANIIRIAHRKGAEFVARLPEAWREGKTAASYAIALSGRAARRMPIAQLGIRYKGKQKVEITRGMLAQVTENFRKRDTGEVPIDYDHAIEMAAGTGEPVPAAGWIKAIDDAPDGDGILWGSVQWTPRAAAMIQAGEYKYISPVIDPNARDNKTGEAQGWTLTSAALTNQPVLQGMPALVLSESGWDNRGDAEIQKEQQNVKKVILADRVARTVRLIADDGTETTMAVEGLEAQPQVLRLSDVKRDAKSGELDFASLVCGEGVLVAGEVFRAQQAQTALSEAIKEGKILPAQRQAYEKMALSDLVSFRDLVATMKPQIDLRVRGTAAAEGEPAGDWAASGLTRLVREKIAASEKQAMPYGEALRLVLAEQPELARAYKSGMGGRK